MKNNILITAFIILATVLVTTAIIGISLKSEQDTLLSTVMENTTITEFQDDYMTGCMEEGASYKFCSCTYEGLLKTYGYEGFVKESLEYVKTNKLSEKMSNVVAQCLE